MTWRALAAGLAFAACAFSTLDDAVADTAKLSYDFIAFSDLDGWPEDDHLAAIEVFQRTCDMPSDPEWKRLCSAARTAADPRAFFEAQFQPVRITDGADALFTGYFEPEINGASERSDLFRHPVYALPPEASGEKPWLSRQEIEASGALRGRGLELAWIAEPVDLFFLQVQGSGRIRFEGGGVLRLGYAGKNGHPYRSIGKELVRRGTFAPEALSADVIKQWVRANPHEGAQLLLHNPSYVFFREVTDVPANQGPVGAMGRSVTPLRSIAVDPDITPLGAPVWLDKAGPNPMRRLMVAQDTGSAIKGAQRADIFFGTGESAGLDAGRLRDGGRMTVLLPKKIAAALMAERTQ